MKNKTLVAVLGGALALSYPVLSASATENPFELKQLSTGYTVLADNHKHDKNKKAEGSCSKKAEGSSTDKKAEGSCSKKAEGSSTDKKAEGSCSKKAEGN